MCPASLLAVLGHWEWPQSQWNDAQWRVTGTQSVPQALQPATHVSQAWWRLFHLVTKHYPSLIPRCAMQNKY